MYKLLFCFPLFWRKVQTDGLRAKYIESLLYKGDCMHWQKISRAKFNMRKMSKSDYAIPRGLSCNPPLVVAALSVSRQTSVPLKQTNDLIPKTKHVKQKGQCWGIFPRWHCGISQVGKIYTIQQFRWGCGGVEIWGQIIKNITHFSAFLTFFLASSYYESDRPDLNT